MSEGADRTIETAGREVQAGITAGADNTVMFWGVGFVFCAEECEEVLCKIHTPDTRLGETTYKRGHTGTR